MRSHVHEYGGRAVLAARGSDIVSNGADHQLHKASADSVFNNLTNTAGLPVVGCVEDTLRTRIICVREDHRGEAEGAKHIQRDYA